MNARRKLFLRISGLVAVLTLVSAAVFVAGATPPSGVSVTLVGAAILPEFDVKRKHKDLDWEIEMEADQPIKVVTAIFTVQPGGHGGWHTHPGPALFTVRTGTLTMYDGNDPNCTPQVFPAGTGSVEAGTSTHNHILRNETNSVAETVVTFLLPVNADLRTDLPNPGNCPF